MIIAVAAVALLAIHMATIENNIVIEIVTFSIGEVSLLPLLLPLLPVPLLPL